MWIMPGSKDRGEGSWRGLETILTSDLAVLKSLLEYTSSFILNRQIVNHPDVYEYYLVYLPGQSWYPACL
jgi:hypothetical protein